MRPHVDVLGRLYLVAACLAALSALALAALGVGASVMGRGTVDVDVAAWLTAGIFLAIAVALLAWGLLCAGTGIGLLRHRPWSRRAALILGLLILVIPPFGTALAVYSFWALLQPEARLLFESNRPIPASN